MKNFEAANLVPSLLIIAHNNPRMKKRCKTYVLLRLTNRILNVILIFPENLVQRMLLNRSNVVRLAFLSSRSAVVVNILNESEVWKRIKMYRGLLFLLLIHSFSIEHMSIELYARLHMLIDYVGNHTESQRPDLMLGIYLSEGNVIISHLINLYIFHMFSSSTENNEFK